MASAAAKNLWVLLGLGLAGVLLMARRLKRVVKEDFGAFVARFELLPPPQPAPPKAPHPLTGLTFAVADAFDVEGYVTGFGNPDWAQTHEPVERTSPVVAALVEGGSTCIGKTVIDDMACSITGVNKHFGTPTNPAAPDRVPGGCSSGSAVAVASGLVDFSLGVDSIGGVRVPAAFCGVFGFRPSHSSISNIGIIPISPSLDTTGWFAKDPSILRRVGHLLLQLPYVEARPPRRIIIADDCFQLMKVPVARVTQVVIKSTEKLYGRQVLNHINLGDYLASRAPSLRQIGDATKNDVDEVSSLVSLANAVNLLHKHEFQEAHKKWFDCVKPVVDTCISSCLRAGLEDTFINCCLSARNESRLALDTLLKDGGILVVPTVSGPPPKLNGKEILSNDFQLCALSLLSIASMSGCCQVTIPLGSHEELPVSVSFIARHGDDRFLLDTVNSMYAVLREQVDVTSNSKLSNGSISQEESAELAKEKGNIAYKEKNWQKAINLYTEAIKLSGSNATYYSNRAAAYLEMGSYLQAEADCSTAISLDKKNVKAYLRRGTAREMLGYYGQAIEDFKHALVLEPTNRTANVALNRLKKLFQ